MQDISIQLEQITEELLQDSAEIIAATAQEYFRDSFRRKAFDGKPWQPPMRPKRTGSLLVASGALANSIRIVEVSPRRVVISAGGDKIAYAEAHNEGYDGVVQVPEHIRRVKPRPLTSGAKKDAKSAQSESKPTTKPKPREVVVKAHKRQLRLPQRQFMGQSRELHDLIRERLLGYISSMNKEAQQQWTNRLSLKRWHASRSVSPVYAGSNPKRDSSTPSLVRP